MDELVAKPSPGRIANHQVVREIRVAGVVQGVGFRPFIYRLAGRMGITGWVRNTSSGVEIRAEGPIETLDAFEQAVRREAPPLARIENLVSDRLDEIASLSGFSILSSHGEPSGYQLISPDIATCPECLSEMFDPANRRYRYPFTNCTNCGPRFTIIKAIPYDRPATTMAGFTMCPQCQAEYDDPGDRRFHAQPNACPVCGPVITLWDAAGKPLAQGDAAMREAAARIASGQILAIKGLGGFQLACDATSAAAVAGLRERKRRPHKAFAVMVSDMAMAERLCVVGDAERELLRRPSAPIVLMRAIGSHLAGEVAPGVGTLGLVLPYTPLHHILMHDVGRPLVMTSGNLSEEPIAQDNDEALHRLARLADTFLTHDRPVHSRYDDSVWFAPAGRPQPVRRARGDAPFPITLPVSTAPMLALGAELKNTFTLTRDRYAFVSQHIGDMENIETLDHQAATLALYESLFGIRPEVVACDLHPDYHTSRIATQSGLPVLRIQHHHAHLASVLAENQLDEPVIGVIWDGTGYGLDGRIWGGEVLVGDARGFTRAAHLAYMHLPGGDAATLHPYRIAWAYLAHTLGEAAAERVPVKPAERQVLRRMIASGTRVTQTSSMGRLFDAVSALLGIRRDASYEGQAAMELEALASEPQAGATGLSKSFYPFSVRRRATAEHWGQPSGHVSQTAVIELDALLGAIVQDLDRGVPAPEIAWRFHAALAELLVSVCVALREETGLRRVALSGGVFQNRLLLEMATARLDGAGFQPVVHRLVPTNDGGLSLGQAYIAHYLWSSAKPAHHTDDGERN